MSTNDAGPQGAGVRLALRAVAACCAVAGVAAALMGAHPGVTLLAGIATGGAWVASNAVGRTSGGSA